MLYRVWVPPKIKRRPPPRTPIDDRQCEVCGVTYSPVRKWQRFCSKPCRRSTEGSKQGPIPPRPCDVCGEDYRPMTRWQRFCSKPCAGRSPDLREWEREYRDANRDELRRYQRERKAKIKHKERRQ